MPVSSAMTKPFLLSHSLNMWTICILIKLSHLFLLWKLPSLIWYNIDDITWFDEFAIGWINNLSGDFFNKATIYLIKQLATEWDEACIFCHFKACLFLYPWHVVTFSLPFVFPRMFCFICFFTTQGRKQWRTRANWWLSVARWNPTTQKLHCLL